MEIGQQCADPAELVGRMDEDIGASLLGLERGGALQDPRAGGADGDDPAARRVGGPFLQPGRDRVGLPMHDVILQPLDLHRPEGAEADVEGDEGVVEAGQQLGREVEPGGRRGHRAELVRVDGLVALAVVDSRRSGRIQVQGEGLPPFKDVGRNRHVAEGLEIDLPEEAEDPLAALQGLEHLGLQGRGARLAGAEAEPHTGEGPLGRFHQGGPVAGAGFLDQEERKGPVLGLEAGGDHPAVVEDQEVVGTEEIRQIGEAGVGEGAVGPVHHQEAGAGPLRGGIGRDQFGRQLEGEIIGTHERGANDLWMSVSASKCCL